MDLKEIQNLIKFVAKSGAAEVNLETEEFKINIKTESAFQQEQPQQILSMPQQTQAPQQAPQAPQAPAPSGGNPQAEAQAQGESAKPPQDDESKYVTIKSPMIGTFYRRPSPDKDVFVSVGDEIKDGTVVCVIEAMKLFNEIESEVKGKIVKVLAEDQSPVEYDQPLFLVDPA